ncbi:NAD(P)-dependent oxidoreductase [Aquirhabdus parva]|uniref:NAD(P)-dependent oxidoreductase n=1 Tax=Aquirhabdus parva TaxID=2283318 RepID=A0A345P2Q0_9GAMM|nr:NAD(P)-dependent oxidoreductase [Aquirhabdus parva]AXI01559.1 NAD(P)-dependent oxidoreductase [Aquirhabdus parva]
MSNATKIAFVGMGLMGSRMSLRLLQAGFDVSVWNRTASAADRLIAQGATKLTDLNQLQDFSILALCLADDAAVEAIGLRLLEQIQPQQIIVDFSSSSVALTQRLAKLTREKDAHWIDAPVSGGVIGAEQGTLVIFAGGDAHVIEDLAPFFAPLSQRVTTMGDSGSGQATKICNQLIVAATSTLIAEAIALAEKSGVDATLLAPALAGGFADSKPFQILAPRMATRQFEPVQWKVQTLEKDLNNAMTLAANHGLSLPVAQRALGQLRQHAAQGYASDDLSSLIQGIEFKS